MKKRIYSILLVFICITNCNLLANEENQSKLFLGANVGYNLMEFYSFDEWSNWRHDFEVRKSIAFRIEYSYKKNPNLIIYSNTSFFNRSAELSGIAFILTPSPPKSPTKLEQRTSESNSFILSDLGIKYNIKIYKELSIFPKVGVYYASRYNEKFYINEVEYKFEEDDIYQNNQIGFNIGGGISYKIHNIKMILEYNYFDTFNEYEVENRQPFIFWNHIHSLNLNLGYEFNFGSN